MTWEKSSAFRLPQWKFGVEIGTKGGKLRSGLPVSVGRGAVVGSLTAVGDTCSWRFSVSRTAEFESSADRSLGKRERHGGEEEEEE